MFKTLFMGLALAAVLAATQTAEAQIFGGPSNDPFGGIGSSRRNIFGGQDYYGRDGRYLGSSRPNILGGYDFTGPGGFQGSSRRNIFGGQDIYGRDGRYQGSTRPNILGGFEFSGPRR